MDKAERFWFLVADEVVQSYKRQFTQEEVGSSFELLKLLPKIVTTEEINYYVKYPP